MSRTNRLNWRDSTQGERIKWALLNSPKAAESPDRKIKQKELAAGIGIKPSSLNQVISGLTGSMTAENTIKAARYLRVNFAWLAEGRGQPDDTGVTKIPVVGRISRKGKAMTIKPVESYEYIRFYSDDANAEFYIIEDNSFAPKIDAGEVILVEPSHPIAPGRPALLIFEDGSMDIARYLYDSPNGIQIYNSYQSDHPGEIRVEKSQITTALYIKARLSELEIMT